VPTLGSEGLISVLNILLAMRGIIGGWGQGACAQTYDSKPVICAMHNVYALDDLSGNAGKNR
jgi:hypothetical protein